MVRRGQDIDNIVISSLNLEKIGKVNYNESGFFIFTHIQGDYINHNLTL